MYKGRIYIGVAAKSATNVLNNHWRIAGFVIDIAIMPNFIGLKEHPEGVSLSLTCKVISTIEVNLLIIHHRLTKHEIRYLLPRTKVSLPVFVTSISLILNADACG